MVDDAIRIFACTGTTIKELTKAVESARRGIVRYERYSRAISIALPFGAYMDECVEFGIDEWNKILGTPCCMSGTRRR